MTCVCDRWQVSVTILLSCSLLYVMGHSSAQNFCVSHISTRTFQTSFMTCEISHECECVTVCYWILQCAIVFYCVPTLCVSMWWNLCAGDVQSSNDWNNLTLLINIWLMAQSDRQWHNLTYCDTVWNIETQCNTLWHTGAHSYTAKWK